MYNSPAVIFTLYHHKGVSSVANLLANSAATKEEACKSNYAQSLHSLMEKYPTGFENFNFKAQILLSEGVRRRGGNWKTWALYLSLCK